MESKKIVYKELDKNKNTSLFFINNFTFNDGFIEVLLDYRKNRDDNIVVFGNSLNDLENRLQKYANVVNDFEIEINQYKIDKIFWQGNLFSEDDSFVSVCNEVMEQNPECMFYYFITNVKKQWKRSCWNCFNDKYKKRAKAFSFENDFNETNCFHEFPLAQLQHFVWEKENDIKTNFDDKVFKEKYVFIKDNSLNSKIYFYLDKNILPLFSYDYDPTFKQIRFDFYDFIGVKDLENAETKVKFYEERAEAYKILLDKMKKYYEIDSDVWKDKTKLYNLLDAYFNK